MKIENPEKKIIALFKINKICKDYIDKNSVSAESFFLNGRIHYQLGEIFVKETFTEHILTNCVNRVKQNAKSEFLNVIRNIKKGLALSRPDVINTDILLLLAKSYYYSGYYGNLDIYKLIEIIDEFELLNNIEDIRFLSIIHILNGKKDFGLEILMKYGQVLDGISGRFFLASANRIAGKYTDSIMGYKYILENTSDSSILKMANINLGKIFFNQSLFKESLFHFSDASRIDERDNLLKIWIGKNYSAMGEKTKAKAIWSEVLVSDQTNMEAKKLLGLM